MSSRHTRRKLAKAKALAKLEGLAQAERSRRIATTVKANKSSPIERNYYPQSCMATLQEKSARGYVASNLRTIEGARDKRVIVLKSLENTG